MSPWCPRGCKGTHVLRGLLATALVLAGAPAIGAYSIQRGPDYDPTLVRIERRGPATSELLSAKTLLQRLRFGGASISPDGRRFAYTLIEMDADRNVYRTALVVGDIGRPERARVVGSAGRPLWNVVGEYPRTDPQWSSDSASVSLVKLTDTDAQVWTWNAVTGGGRQLTRLTTDALCHVWLKGSHEVGVQVRAGTRNTLAPPRDTAYLWTDSMMALQLLPHLDRAEEFDPPSDVVIANGKDGRTRSATDAESDLIRSQCRTPFRAAATADRVEIPSHGVARSAQLEDRDSRSRLREPSHLSILDKSGSDVASTAVGEHTELLGWLDRDRYFAFLSSPAPGQRYLSVFDSASGAFKELRAGLPASWLQGCSSPTSGATLVCFAEAPNRLPVLVAVRIDAAQTFVLADPNAHLQNAAQSGYRLQQRSWTDRSGEVFQAFVMIPEKSKPARGYPVIVATYYFPGQFLVSGGEEAPLQVMAHRGFVIVCLTSPPRRTAASSYQEAMRDWDAPLEVMQTMLAELSAEELVDRTRAGILGLSFGAELVDHAISHSSLFAAAASAGGGSHDPPFLAYAEPAGMALYAFPGTWWDEGVTLERWREFSPMLRAKQITTPLLIQAADRESMLPLPKLNQLKRYGKPAEMWVFPDERHVKWWPRNKLSTNERNLAWFEFWLMGRCGTWRGDSQYCMRWEQLRKDADVTER